MSFQRVQGNFDFVISGEIIRGDFSFPATIGVKYPTNQTESAYFKAAIDSGTWPTEFENLHDEQVPIQLIGRRNEGRDIWVPELRLSAWTEFVLSDDEDTPSEGVSCEGFARTFVEGDLSDFTVSESKIACYITISPTPILLSVPRGVDRRLPISLTTHLGEAKLVNVDLPRNKDALASNENRSESCQIIFDVSVSGFISLRSVFLELKPILDELLLLVSFLSHKRVVWHNAHLSLSPVEDNLSIKKQHELIAYNQTRLGYERKSQAENAWINVPVKALSLREDLFNQLLLSYQDLPIKSTIRQAILYLLMSHEDGYFEARLGIAYAALESLVAEVGGETETYLLASGEFKRLSKELKEVIKAKIADQSIASAIIAKLPELRRPPMEEKVIRLLQKYNLDQIKLWKSGTVLTMVPHVLKHRNIYIHRGKIESDHLYDLYFLQNLIELWILKILCCPDGAINPSAYRCLQIEER